jgi:hypothetical protein
MRLFMLFTVALLEQDPENDAFSHKFYVTCMVCFLHCTFESLGYVDRYLFSPLFLSLFFWLWCLSSLAC